MLHAGLLVLALAQWLWGLPLLTIPEVAAARSVTIIISPPNRESLVASLDLTAGREEPANSLVDGESLLAQLADPRWQDLVEPVDDSQAQKVAGRFVHEELARIVNDSNARSHEVNLQQLAELSERLEEVFTPENVADINNQLNKLLGNEQRADRPAEEQPAGEFDFATAQLHDVQREQNEAGAWIYTATMVDAAGRRFATPMSAAEGEQAYRTMQLIKKNPLLERVYRGVVMSLMDQMLKGR